MEKIITTIILVNVEITIIFEFENMMYLFRMSPKKTFVTVNFEIVPLNGKKKIFSNLQ